MFTFLVSWLVVACVPGLLMLATLGLSRLEKALARDTPTATAAAKCLNRAEAVDVHTVATEGMPEALDYLHQRQAQRLNDTPWPRPQPGRHRAESLFAPNLGDPAESGLAAHPPTRSRANPQFTTTRRVNRV